MMRSLPDDSSLERVRADCAVAEAALVHEPVARVELPVALAAAEQLFLLRLCEAWDHGLEDRMLVLHVRDTDSGRFQAAHHRTDFTWCKGVAVPLEQRCNSPSL